MDSNVISWKLGKLLIWFVLHLVKFIHCLTMLMSKRWSFFPIFPVPAHPACMRHCTSIDNLVFRSWFKCLYIIIASLFLYLELFPLIFFGFLFHSIRNQIQVLRLFFWQKFCKVTKSLFFANSYILFHGPVICWLWFSFWELFLTISSSS